MGGGVGLVGEVVGWSRHRRRQGSGLVTGKYCWPVVVSCCEALNEVARAAELPGAEGEAGEGGPPRLARPVGYEGEHTGAGVGDMPEERWDVAERWVCMGAGWPHVCS